MGNKERRRRNLGKVFEGWVQVAGDYDYGPTLVKYVGREKGFTPYPLRCARTSYTHLDDEKWEELELIPGNVSCRDNDGCMAYRVRITVEILEEKKLEQIQR